MKVINTDDRSESFVSAVQYGLYRGVLFSVIACVFAIWNGIATQYPWSKILIGFVCFIALFTLACGLATTLCWGAKRLVVKLLSNRGNVSNHPSDPDSE